MRPLQFLAALVLGCSVMGSPAAATRHLVVGLPEGAISVRLDDQVILSGLRASPSGVVSFERPAEEHGRYTVAPDSLTFPACPNLRVTGTQYTGIDLCGTPLQGKVQVTNAGEALAAGSLAELKLDGVRVGTVTIPALAPGAAVWSDWLRISGPAGRHVLVWCADAGHVVAESDEGDNCSGTP